MTTEIDAVKAEVAAVKAKVEGLEKKIEGVEEKIKETEAGRPWLSLTEREQDRLSGLQREKTSLQETISSLQETISSLQDKENILLSQLSTGIPILKRQRLNDPFNHAIAFVNDSLEELVTIPSSSRGRCFFDCIILLKAIYDAVRVNPRNFSISSFSNATTLEESSTQEITIAANDLLSSGKYIVRLADGAPLCLSWTVRDIYPVGIVGRALTAEEMILIETELVAEDKRSTLLKLKVSQRDHVCLLSGRADRVTLAHIFARAWCQNTTNRMGNVRREDRDRILTVGVDSPANGMLLAPVHAAAFDDGLFAIRLNESRQYEVLAISPEYMDFDKYLLYDGKRAEEIGLPGIPPMDSALLEFQLKCAVLRNMKAAAEPVDLLLQDNDELDEIADELLKRGNLSPETIKSGLNWGVVERALNYTSKENAFKPATFAILKDPAGGELTDANTSGSSDE